MSFDVSFNLSDTQGKILTKIAAERMKSVRYGGAALFVNPLSNNLFVGNSSYVAIPYQASATFVWNSTAGKWY